MKLSLTTLLGAVVVGAAVFGVVADPGSGRLTGTTYIQRTATTGGRAPAASECDVTGEIAEIAYTADYHFWKTTGA